MNIWITRHGQTDYNKARIMQGRHDIPLNKTGIRQAENARKLIKNISFDAVYSSPLIRAVSTAAILGGIPESDVIKDERIIETNFGKYEARNYNKLGPTMTLFWTFPELFSPPEGVESIPSMIRRSRDFMCELESKDYKNVLIVCHGGIIRVLCGYLEDRKNGIKWRPRPKNCEIRVYRSVNGRHSFLRAYKNE